MPYRVTYRNSLGGGAVGGSAIPLWAGLPGGAGIAALGLETDNGLSEHKRRRRRANLDVEGGRRRRFVVVVDDDERDRLVAAAAAQGVTVPRLLVESALAPAGETTTQRQATLTRLFGLRRTLGGIGVNVNQIAHQANTDDEVPSGAHAAIDEVRDALARLSTVLEELDL